MPHDPQGLLDFFTKASGRSGDAQALFVGHLAKRAGDAQALFVGHLAKLDAIVAALKASPLAPCIRVFGSSIVSDGRIPGDIDVFFKAPFPIEGTERRDAFRAVLALTEGGNHGMFDPFRIVPNANREKGSELMARGDRQSDNVWIKADWSTRDAILSAGLAGVPVLEFTRSFVEEFSPAAEPAMPAP